MGTESCKHRMAYAEPHTVGGGWTAQGLVCKKCGFQTVSVEEYVPIEKACPSCGQMFEGMPDEDDEICGGCVMSNVDAWIEQIKACPHKNLRHGMCQDCGTGIHGQHQWRWRLRSRIEHFRLCLGIG